MDDMRQVTEPDDSSTLDFVDLNKLRISIDEAEARLAEARENVNGAAKEIERIEVILSKWRRYQVYQRQRVGILERRIYTDRQMLRSEEDYQSGIEP